MLIIPLLFQSCHSSPTFSQDALIGKYQATYQNGKLLLYLNTNNAYEEIFYYTNGKVIRTHNKWFFLKGTDSVLPTARIELHGCFLLDDQVGIAPSQVSNDASICSFPVEVWPTGFRLIINPDSDEPNFKMVNSK